MVRGAAPFRTDRRGYHVAWDAVPAWICHQGGDPYFEAREVERIRRTDALACRFTFCSLHLLDQRGWGV
jgi:hypothetical protein